MKITIELPDTTACAFINYVSVNGFSMSMGVKSLDSDDLRKLTQESTQGGDDD